MNARHFSAGLFGIIMGTLVLIKAKDPAKYYVISLIILGMILFFNSFRKKYAYSSE